MACTRMSPRELRRKKLTDKYAAQRRELKVVADNRGERYTFDEIREAQLKLRKLPRDASPCRQRNRCGLCGRPRGVLRKFKMCRMCVRKYGMRGFIPGLVLSSW